MSPRRLWPLLPCGRGEAPTSLLSRLAALHGRTLSCFCRDLGLSYKGIVDGLAGAIAGLAGLVGTEAAALESNALTKLDEGHWSFKGEIMAAFTLIRSAKRFCPYCLANDIARAAQSRHAQLHAYGRAVWTLEPIRSCQEHGVALLTTRSAKNPSELHDFAGMIAPVLENLPSLQRTATAVEQSPLESYLCGRLINRSRAIWLDDLAWHAAADACQAIGVVDRHGPDVQSASLSDEQRRDAGSAGFAIAAEGESGIRRFLADLDRSYAGSRMSTDGPQARYGALFRRLANTIDETGLDPLRDIVIRHVVETTPVGPEDRIFGKLVERRVMHSIRSASLEYAMHPMRLRKILVAKSVIPDDPNLTDERALFAAELHEELLQKAASSLSLTEVEKYLNAGRVHARLLADERFIEPFVELPSERAGEKNFARADLDRFLADLFKDAHSVRTPAPNVYSIPDAAKRANCRAGEIVRLILDRKLAWVGRLTDVAGFMSALVDLDEIKQHVHGPARTCLTAHEIEKRLATRSAVVAALIDQGQLPTTTVINPINRCPTRVVHPKDIEMFEKEFVSLNNLAKEVGRHFRVLTKELEARGIYPTLSRDIYHASFYRRIDVEDL